MAYGIDLGFTLLGTTMMKATTSWVLPTGDVELNTAVIGSTT
jgi:hypothetical protein